jgi:hypothetical protein
MRYCFFLDAVKDLFYSLASTGKALWLLRSMLFEDKWGGTAELHHRRLETLRA